MYLWRPCIAEPPLCTMLELNTVWTIDDLADFHEVLDLKEAFHDRARRESERKNKR